MSPYNPKFFLRLARWARHPPSKKQVILVLSIIGICLILVFLERFVGLPDWMQLDPRPGRGFRIPRP